MQGRSRSMMELEKSGLNRFSKIAVIANMKPIFSTNKESIDSAVTKIINSNHRSLPVVDSKLRVLGILTASDILDSFLIGQDFSQTVTEIMHRDVLTCNYDDTIGFVLQKFKMSRRGRFPLTKGGSLEGIVSERDIVKYFANMNFQNKIESIMTTKPLFISPHITILDAIKTIVNTHYRRLPILENNKVVGLIMANDLLKVMKMQNYKFSLLQDQLSTVMIKNVISVRKDEDVSVAIKTMMVHDIDGVIVSDNQKLEGILTERNILEHIN
jgi:CBS domain-containing protein